MGIFKQFATNKQAERDGVPFTYEPNADGSVPTLFCARVRRTSVTYQAAFERHTRAYKDRMDRLTAEEDEAIMQGVFVDVAVRGWDNIRLPKGVGGIGKGDAEETYAQYVERLRPQPEMPADAELPVTEESWMTANAAAYNIPFTHSHALTLFNLLPDMWRDAAERAAEADTYRTGDLEAMAKN